MKRVGRLAALVALGAVLVFLGVREWQAHAERELAGGSTVGADVPAARRALAERLLQIERATAETAESALRATRSVTDQVELFAALEALDLGDSGGVHVEDRYGRILAWAGDSLRDPSYEAIPRDRRGGWIVEAPTSRRIAVVRSREDVPDATAAVADVPARAICHRPIELIYPLRSRVLESWSLEEDVAARFRVGTVRVLPPGSSEGEALQGAFGEPLARLDILPLSSASWIEAVDEATERRRGAVLALFCLIVALATCLELPRIVERRGLRRAWVPLGCGAVIAGARFALTAYPVRAILGDGPLTDPARYAGSLPFGLGDSPAGFLLTGVCSIVVAAALRQATLRLRPLPLRVPTCLVSLLAVAIGGRVLLGALVEDVVTNSTVQFFAVERVLPYPASAALLAGLFAMGAAVVLTLEAAFRTIAPDVLRARRHLLPLAFLGALVVAPLGPLAPAGARTIPLVAVLGFAAALGSMALSPGVAMRAAVIPVAVAIGLFVPLERYLTRSLQQEVVHFATEHSAGGGTTAGRGERQAVEGTLDQVGRSPELVEAMRRGRLPRDLAARLWADSPLSDRAAPSRLELLPADANVHGQSFSADAPPSGWLPDPATFPGGEQRWTITSAGRGLAQDSEWVIGETPVRDGDELLGSVRVVLGMRRALIARLLELDTPGGSGRRDTRRPLPPAVSEFDADGRLVWTDDPYRAAGSQLAADTHAVVVGGGGSRWARAPMGDAEATILYTPRRDDGGAVIGASAFVVESGGATGALSDGTKAALFGAVLALLALAATAGSWARHARLRLAQQLVISYAIVAALPLLLLAGVNHELVRQRYEARSVRDLRESVSVMATMLFQAGGTPEWAKALQGTDVDGADAAAADALRDAVYSPGHRSNLFVGHRLRASSDQSLSDTPFQPARMPGGAFREVTLRGRPFYVETAAVGRSSFMIGYAPLRSADGAILGAVSVPLIHQQELREREQAQAATAVLGFYLASLAAAMAAGTWLAARLAAPLRDLRDAARRVAGGDLSEPVRSPGPSELGDVVDSFNTMMSDLAESRGRLVKAEKEAAWRDMARQIAHEVKNPLTPMRLAAEHLRRAYRDGTPDFGAVLQRAVDVIVRQTAALQRIATDFRDFARLPVQRRERVDLGAVLRRVLDLYRGVDGLTIEVEVVSDLPHVLGDPDELQRVLVNICGNAVEAQAGDLGVLRGRLAAEGGWLVCTIQDAGPGIPPELHARLFEPSFSTKTGGTGLGLAICKRAVEDLGGTIHVRSEVGRGTAVVVRLPAAEPE